MTCTMEPGKKHGKNANIISSSQQNQKQVNVGGNVDECKDVGFGQIL